MLYLYIYLILKTDNTARSVSQNLPWVGWGDETISQIEGAEEWEVKRERGRALCNPYYILHRAASI